MIYEERIIEVPEVEIHEVITAQAVDVQRAAFKRQVRDVANGARNFATGLRRRMNALGGRDSGGNEADNGDSSAQQSLELSTEPVSGESAAPALASPVVSDHEESAHADVGE